MADVSEERNQEVKEDEKPEPPVNPEYKLDILMMVKNSRTMYGLRHSNYERYRQYCSRRLCRLRKMIRNKQGKRFTVRVIKPSTVCCSEFLLLPLFLAERCWSYAMELKEQLSSSRCKHPLQVKRHLMKRLAKAAKWSNALLLCCTHKGDAKTALEAEAYSCWMNGTVLLENEDWEKALEKFVRARAIYNQLAKLGDFDQQEICKANAAELEPTIRYVNYNINPTADHDLDLIELQIRGTGNMDMLTDKIERVMEESRKKQAGTINEIMWKDKSVPIRSEKLRLALANIQGVQKQLQLFKEKEEDTMQVYDSLLMAFNEANIALAEEKKQLSTQKATQKITSHLADLDLVSQYLHHRQASHVLDRNVSLVQTMKKKLGSKNEKTGKQVKPEDLINLYDTLSKTTEEFISMEENSTSERSKELAAQALTYRSFRCFYMAKSFANAKKYSEAGALFDKATERAKSALEHHKNCNTNQIELIKELEELVNNALGEKCIVQANALLQSQTEENQNSVPNPLLNNPSAFDSGTVSQGTITEFPPGLDPVSCRPLLFDMAFMECTFPSLEKKKNPPSLFTRGWSFWRS